MESMEERTRRIVKAGKIQDTIVATLYGTVALTLHMAAPNTLQLLKYIHPYIGQRNAKRRLSQGISRLISKGVLKREGYGSTSSIALTDKGRRYAEKLYARVALSVHKPRVWDERWRIVMFDIWEKRRSVRDRLRYLLQKIGFVKIQNSVWAYPYDCEEVIVLIRTELRVGKGAMYLIADGIEGDGALRKHFGL